MHPRLSWDHPIPEEAYLIGTEDVLAYFGTECEPRTAVKLIVEARNNYPRYRPLREGPLPARLTLPEIVQHYPKHVTGTMLRVFTRAGWSARAIYDLLPEGARRSESTAKCPWGYINMARQREKQRMQEEVDSASQSAEISGPERTNMQLALLTRLNSSAGKEVDEASAAQLQPWRFL